MTTQLRDDPAHSLSVFRANNEQIIKAHGDPRLMARLFRSEDISGKRVLDIGANTGGLSLELARMGGIVRAAEPFVFTDIARDIARDEELSIEWTKDILFQIHLAGPYDTIVCFGLLYHFRHPHFVIDYLSSVGARVLYISSQTAVGDGAALVNRASGVLAPRLELAQGTRGYHPTHSMLVRMLQASGYDNVELLTDRPYNWPELPPGGTNSAYYRALLRKRVDDPLLLAQTFEARW